MDFIGFDLGKVASQICIITAEGELLEYRIKTDREQLAKLLGGRPQARILIEAGTESEWVARYLEQLGHEVVVAARTMRAYSCCALRPLNTFFAPQAELLQHPPQSRDADAHLSLLGQMGAQLGERGIIAAAHFGTQQFMMCG